MIDFHSHILPAIDDGSKDEKCSIEMMRLSAAQGVAVMVATPHFYIEDNDVSTFLNKRAASFLRLQKAMKEIQGLPEVVLGAEVLYFRGLSKLTNLELLCIEDTDCMMVEMPFESWSMGVLDELAEISAVQGITPIIAHLDRFLAYKGNDKYVDELLRLGAYIQINCDCFSGLFAKRRIFKLLAAGKVHLLGSDCHNLSSRPPNIQVGCDVIKNRFGERILSEIDDLGRSILGR